MVIKKDSNVEVKETMYFNKPRRINTDRMLEFITPKIASMGIRHVMIAWSSGYTLRKFMEAVKDLNLNLNIAAVTNPKGGTMGGRSVSIDDKTQEDLEKKGVKVCYLNDDLHLGEPMAPSPHQKFLRDMLLPWLPAHIDPLSLEVGVDLSLFFTLSQGYRVAVGCLVLAVRQGFIPPGEKVLCLSGMATAAIISSNSQARYCYLDEILTMERNSDWGLLNPQGVKKMVAITL
jgi:hypothetical protein